MTNRCLTCGSQDWCGHHNGVRQGDTTNGGTPCARGCITRSKHLSTCTGTVRTLWAEPPAQLWSGDHRHPFADRAYAVRALDGWAIEEHRECRGCRPRLAKFGVLCESDHNLLTRWLDTDRSRRGLTWVHAWLGENLARGGTSAARQDWQRTAGKGGPPLPIREGIHDLRVLLSDRVEIADERVREVFERPASDGFDLASSCNFLSAWLTKIETNADLTLWLFDKLDEVMRDAGVLAPWTDKPRPITGISCPECERRSLAVYPGEEDVTCRNCWVTIDRRRYDIWTRMLADEARGGAA